MTAFPVPRAAVEAVARRGGFRAAAAALTRFVARALARYDVERNYPDRDATSGLSPYLHFGHVSPHEILAAVTARESWTPEQLVSGGRGARAGWWRLSAAAEAFLDQLVTWRELGHHTAAHRPGFERYESLPEWAQRLHTAGGPVPYGIAIAAGGLMIFPSTDLFRMLMV